MAVAHIALQQPLRLRALPPCRAEATLSVERPAYSIRPTTTRLELSQAAWLRAESYYEERSVGRFKASFVKQFAGQMLYSLLRNTQGPQPECITLVATEWDGSSGSPDGAPAPPSPAAADQAATGPGGCLGTLDVRLLVPDSMFGDRWPDGIPLDGPAPAAYVSNVVVAPSQRGRGLGRQLVAAAAARAGERWGVAQLWCHVETANEPAMRLYTGSGFSQQGEELPPAEEGQGPRLLLGRSLGG